MKTIAVFAAVLAVASAASIVRVPSADSAVIESHRLGGSFAYSTQEGHAVGVVSPVVQNVVSPVATSYSAVAQVPVSTSWNVNGVPTVYSNVNGLPTTVLSNTHQLGNVAVVRSGDLLSNTHQLQNVAVVRSGDLLSNTHQLQNVAVVRSGDVLSSGVQQVQLVNGVHGLTHLNNVGVLPVSSVVV